MRAIAIASVVVAFVAAAAYAGPKMYWYYHQVQLIRAQMNDDDERLDQLRTAMKEATGATKRPAGTTGQYL